MLAELTCTCVCATEIAPGKTVIVGNAEVIGARPIVAPTLDAVPEVVPVKTAEYVPSLLSTVAARVPLLTPPLRLKATLSPPEVKLLP